MIDWVAGLWAFTGKEKDRVGNLIIEPGTITTIHGNWIPLECLRKIDGMKLTLRTQAHWYFPSSGPGHFARPFIVFLQQLRLWAEKYNLIILKADF
jgi:hypothetical protein